MRKKKILMSIFCIAFLQLIFFHLRFAPKKNFLPNFLANVPLTQPVIHHPATYNSTLVIPILVLAFNRPSVSRCIKSILNARPSSTHFPLIVSQDGAHLETQNVIKSFPHVLYWQQSNQTDFVLPKKQVKLQGYFHLSRHYKWALDKIFTTTNYTACILIEDDLEVSADFFEYMTSTHNLLQSDPSLYCVSAWNDNGKPELIDKERPELIHRTDFFPGLGWMLTKKLWMEFRPQWPDAFWDDWMRSPEIRKDRNCLRPEISRTTNFGMKGVSNGLHFKDFLGRIDKHQGYVPFSNYNLDYLKLDDYNEEFLRRVYSAKLVTNYKDLIGDLKAGTGKARDKEDSYRVTYSSTKDFVAVAKEFKIMKDFKSGIPRTAYRGIVPFKYLGKSIFISPIYDWRGYNVTWK